MGVGLHKKVGGQDWGLVGSLVGMWYLGRGQWDKVGTLYTIQSVCSPGPLGPGKMRFLIWYYRLDIRKRTYWWKEIFSKNSKK